eukprot:gene27771-34540_t
MNDWRMPCKCVNDDLERTQALDQAPCGVSILRIKPWANGGRGTVRGAWS